MAIQLATLADSIAALSVDGVRMFDIDEVPSSLSGRVPAIIPLASDFITDFTIEIDSQGGYSTAQKTLAYTIHYRLCYAQVGEGRTNKLVHFPDLVAKAMLFLDALLDINTIDGAIDVQPLPITSFGIVNDPAEVPYWGCDFALRVMEFDN